MVGRMLNEYQLQVFDSMLLVGLENLSISKWFFGFNMWKIDVNVLFLLVMLCSLNVMVIKLKWLLGNGNVFVLVCM